VNGRSFGVGKNRGNGLANPTRLKPLEKREGLLRVIIETPKGSRNKFAFDLALRMRIP
jgi:inorganic pyrophosphatase